MLGKLVKTIIGSRNDRLVKKKMKIVKKINSLEPQIEKLTDAELKAKTVEFRERLANGEKLEALLPEAFAVVRETSQRVLKMRHYDVQLVGGMVLNDGKIAEMKTGEGKTLVATLAAYLNALPGLGVHVVTVNDYLARRDAEWMGEIYGFLGLTTGVIISNMEPAERRAAYAADITYGTNNEYGFDYLRDNMAFTPEDRVQRGRNFAIVDEVDSILVDEARTPLIISGPTEDRSDLYHQINRLIPRLSKQEKENGPGDYSVDEKSKQVYLTEDGHERIEQMMEEHGLIKPGQSLYEAANIRLMHYINACLRANVLFQKDVDYIVRDNQIIIVDEFTGRAMLGRRWSEGLHQAMEAKEGVTVQNENQTLASITFQNYFRLYNKLSGMTGTADTEAYEFQQIYNLEVVVIPSNVPNIRKDLGDLVYLNVQGKYNAILEDIKDCVKRGQPVLVGTTSIENSELLSGMLQQAGIEHNVLNAKHHEREAHIVAEAGRPSAVTIATNMAGRGTDIILGGNLKEEITRRGLVDTADIEQAKIDWTQRHQAVVASGGLHVIGSERHESRRIDNQLRGRCGRQGDPGSTRFYLSLQDSLMRIFASDRVAMFMQKLGMTEDEAIEHSMVTKSIENAQRKVEARNFDIRKSLLEYDNVANDQRRVIYFQRDALMESEDISETITAIREDVINIIFRQFIPEHTMEEQWDIKGLEETLEQELNVATPISQWLEEDHYLHEEKLKKLIIDRVQEDYDTKSASIGLSVMHHFEKSVMLQVLDDSWKEHLAAMDHLRMGIHLRGYAQKDPKQEYKREAFEMFTNMLDSVKQEVISVVSRVQVRSEEEVQRMEEAARQKQREQELSFQHAEAERMSEDETHSTLEEERKGEQAKPFVRDGVKIGRNDPCPCGSGKKYKQCHGKLD